MFTLTHGLDIQSKSLFFFSHFLLKYAEEELDGDWSWKNSSPKASTQHICSNSSPSAEGWVAVRDKFYIYLSDIIDIWIIYIPTPVRKKGKVWRNHLTAQTSGNCLCGGVSDWRLFNSLCFYFATSPVFLFIFLWLQWIAVESMQGSNILHLSMLYSRIQAFFPLTLAHIISGKFQKASSTKKKKTTKKRPLTRDTAESVWKSVIVMNNCLFSSMAFLFKMYFSIFVFHLWGKSYILKKQQKNNKSPVRQLSHPAGVQL